MWDVYIPDLTERFPEGFGGVDLTPSFFGEPVDWTRAIGYAEDEEGEHIERYDAMLGFNTNQWWLYDNERDVYIDPPIFVLDKVDELPSETADDLEKQRELLIALAYENEKDWVKDEDYIYDDIEI